jgi:hypothetical protein
VQEIDKLHVHRPDQTSFRPQVAEIAQPGCFLNPVLDLTERASEYIQAGD